MECIDQGPLTSFFKNIMSHGVENTLMTELPDYVALGLFAVPEETFLHLAKNILA